MGKIKTIKTKFQKDFNYDRNVNVKQRTKKKHSRNILEKDRKMKFEETQKYKCHVKNTRHISNYNRKIGRTVGDGKSTSQIRSTQLTLITLVT